MKFIYQGYVYEARNLNDVSPYMGSKKKSTIGSESALKDSDVVTVYHGIAYLRDVYKILSNGVDGSIVVPRKDSYENIENPRGLFVSPSIKTAEYFATSGYVIEFNCKVSDLDTPMWNKEDDDDVVNNREPMRMALRDKHSASKDSFVRDADRPELAASFSRRIEPQALFVGKLLPNQIKAVWYDPSRDLSSNTFEDHPEENWTRLSINQAKSQLRKVPDSEKKAVDDIDTGTLPDGSKV